MSIGYLAIIIGFAIIGFLVQNRLKGKFRKYGQVALSSGMSGKEVAEKMLADHGIHDVQVLSVPGELTDHYNPQRLTVNLSPDVYHGRSISAAAVAAHECGHAVQHKVGYQALQMRSALVPAVNVSSQLMNYIFLASIFFAGVLNLFPMNSVFLMIIICQAIITLFTVITLPVEFDASKRAVVWLDNAGITHSQAEYDGAKDALTWAGMTYLVAALSSVVTLLYFVMQYMGGSDD